MSPGFGYRYEPNAMSTLLTHKLKYHAFTNQAAILRREPALQPQLHVAVVPIHIRTIQPLTMVLKVRVERPDRRYGHETVILRAIVLAYARIRGAAQHASCSILRTNGANGMWRIR
jgi:hypothetical protein